jgi:DNA-binding NarL/FixJ family response regulator
LIRVAIIAERRSQAEALANLLAQDERMEILHAGDRLNGLPEGLEDIMDVLIAARIAPEQIPVRGVPVVVLSDAPARGEVFARDVRASLPLRSSSAEVSAAIAAAAAHLFVLTDEQMQQRSRTAATEVTSAEFAEALTPRELEVLRTLANGLGNKEIAEQLGVSNNTVKFHIAQIMAKLGAHSRTEAVMMGMRRGLVAV